ncbi:MULTISPECIES: ABC-F family ATP-binding cassette domain-containing protein [unclassified Halomonas]|uniref:ABC-F family ATP-binding cassette domain-containing protein n=1 Tax=unclassified Halomonas TaxID=2609666 RepID=UPI0007DA2284|nr:MULTISPECIES: ABC-F family ATP-binding cassette domain-containing protein [unclassified Halomonas]MBT2785526.1 ABC-F family ATP-binding cassette domain-containing protein [Halomonas sp. ISL-106]MBT2797790.1 ABC-F family ATP-binding cassette domain-containing protein [Halomonas sp. ISL-104]OAL59368.1 ABC transporter ATP-binding protein [Halomonas sp. ALS9]
MTTTHLTLKGVSYVLPDGRTLFTDLYEQFDTRPTGLVGRNGVGKTVLAQILAGLLQPASGHCQRPDNVHYLAQQVAQLKEASVADLANVRATLDALARIETGSTAPEDFEAVDDRWDLPQRFRHELDRNGLGYLEATTPASTLSGGEAMRIALMGAMLSDANFLILDEPSNHLDRPNRQALIEQLQRWPRGLIVVSHDRQLLESMERIVELSPSGLHSYGGNYTFYAEAKAHEQQTAIDQLNQHKLERQRQERAMRKQRERQEKRQARGNRQGKEANQAKSILDGQKERSENSTGALRQKQAASREQLNQRVREAAKQVEDAAHITLHEIPVNQVAKRCLAELERVELPFVKGATRRISLMLRGPQRIGIIGPNGCGKSTLLRVLAGQMEPLAGTCKVTPESAYLDQRLENLEPEKSVLEQLQLANRSMTEGELRMLLAQLGLDTHKITTPSGRLSGGERLKGALACILYAESRPQLLLLDEPNNHLDLPSAQALEALLRSYQGALVVVSHDDAFLKNLALTDRLLATEQGWLLEPV